jgi:hypothetical protein
MAEVKSANKILLLSRKQGIESAEFRQRNVSQIWIRILSQELAELAALWLQLAHRLQVVLEAVTLILDQLGSLYVFFKVSLQNILHPSFIIKCQMVRSEMCKWFYVLCNSAPYNKSEGCRWAYAQLVNRDQKNEKSNSIRWFSFLKCGGCIKKCHWVVHQNAHDGTTG